jgi:opacity protein-like surface antigen
MRRISRHAFAALLACLCLAVPATAQQSTTRGFVIGLHGSGASLVVEDQDRNNAGGGGIIVGYGVNRRITILAQADGAEFDEQSTGEIQGTWTMGHFDLGVRFNFANSLRRLVPFLQGTLGARAVSVSDPFVNGTSEEEVSFTGPSVTLGGGVDIYFSEGFALDLALLWTGGEFNTIRVNDTSQSGFDFDARSTRLNIGVAWWP